MIETESLKDRLRNLWFFYLINHYTKRSIQTVGYWIENAPLKRRSRRLGPLSIEEVQQALKERWAGKDETKRKGTLNLIYLSHRISTYARLHLLPTLKLFGRVWTFEPADYGWNYASDKWIRQRPKVNEKLLQWIDALPEKPDLLIGELTGRLIQPETVHRLKQKGILTVQFSCDDTVSFYGPKIEGIFSGPAGLAPHVDLNVTTARESQIKYLAEGGLSIFLPLAANPDFCKPEEAGFRYDVSFVGQRYGYRPLFIQFLMRHGIRVATFGRGWERGEISDEEMLEVFGQSRINLGFGGKDHLVRVQHLKGRDFEVPMSGGLYLTSYHPDLAECYEVGKEIVCYKDKWDCLEKIRYLLRHPEIAQSIREAARQRALKDHTWQQRFETLLKMVGLLG